MWKSQHLKMTLLRSKHAEKYKFINYSCVDCGLCIISIIRDQVIRFLVPNHQFKSDDVLAGPRSRSSRTRRCPGTGLPHRMWQSMLLIERPSERQPRDLLALDRKQRRLVTGLSTGHGTLSPHINVVGLSDNDVWRCGKEDRTPTTCCVSPQLWMDMEWRS
jgi:hypothetical protein